jgi:hypothetical protein
MVIGLLVVLALSTPAEAAPAPELQSATPSPAETTDEGAVRKVIADYAKAIEHKDIDLFKAVKPNLSPDEEKRARAGFASVQSQVVKITFLSIDLKDRQALVKITRRDMINGSIPASFPQTFTMSKGKAGWVIDEIGR